MAAAIPAPVRDGYGNRLIFPPSQVRKFKFVLSILPTRALNGEGMLLDDISVPQIDYFTDFEKDDGGWQADGFARVQNTLPQTYQLSLILMGNTTTVQQIALDGDQSVSINLTLGNDVRNAVLVVSGTTRFTRQTATYTVSVTP